jgi:isopentenyl diphosphate isomerase/L-lactate dehydrogenase-like FMN-dependent dehydrogenase
VQRADDAVRSVEAGARAVIVSNHGARQLADAPPTADVLPEIVDAVAGRAEVYVDGGVRRSPDVVKALALGARATLVGRPSLWALAIGGAAGITRLLRWYEAELRRALALVGAPTVDAVDRSLVRRTPGWTIEGPLP